MVSVFSSPTALKPNETYQLIMTKYPQSPLAPLATIKLGMWQFHNKSYLESLAKQGLFREDLLFRLQGVGIELPPLAGHPDDILELATAFRIPNAPVANGASMAALEHFRERGSFVRNPRDGFLQPGHPYRMRPAQLRRPAPAVDGGRRDTEGSAGRAQARPDPASAQEDQQQQQDGDGRAGGPGHEGREAVPFGLAFGQDVAGLHFDEVIGGLVFGHVTPSTLLCSLSV